VETKRTPGQLPVAREAEMATLHPGPAQLALVAVDWRVAPARPAEHEQLHGRVLEHEVARVAAGRVPEGGLYGRWLGQMGVEEGRYPADVHLGRGERRHPGRELGHRQEPGHGWLCDSGYRADAPRPASSPIIVVPVTRRTRTPTSSPIRASGPSRTTVVLPR